MTQVTDAIQTKDVKVENVDAANVNVFDTLAENIESTEKSREDIIRSILSTNTAKRINNLHVRNVVVGTRTDGEMSDNGGFLTFVVKEFVFGDTYDQTQLDAFGQPTIKIGRTHNVQVSTYALAGLMKDSAKSAIFAAQVVDNPAKANMLYAGGTIDIVLQFVAAGEEYTNPFATSGEAVTFDRDKVIAHIVKANFGEVGEDLYKAMLLK